MDAETLAHLFEPFFTTNEVGKGTGLGLATVYGIVSQSGGQIRVDSAPGRGTVFRIYLPAVRPGGAHADTGPSAQRAGSETVLIVEDETAVRALVREILELSGYAVLEARGPHEALELLARRRGPVQLVVTDVVMPEMSGRELVERLARISPDTPVLYMSGYTDNELGRHGVLDSSTVFLHKPFTPDGLCRKVREVLDAARQGWPAS
jgi:CheY-like chemotaxis protein